MKQELEALLAVSYPSLVDSNSLEPAAHALIGFFALLMEAEKGSFHSDLPSKDGNIPPRTANRRVSDQK
jgi:hypothetical protein